MSCIRIVGTGSGVPESVVTNDDLSKIVETDDQWISSRTGIKERRISQGENTSELGAKAAMNALEDAGLTAMDIDIIIVATTTPDSFTPSTACIVQDIIGAKKAYAFDVSAACSGFIYGVNIATKMLKAGDEKRALIIGAETLSKVLDWNDRSTCVLFGDGAGAVVLEKGEEEGILASTIGSDGTLGRASLSCGIFNVHNPFVKDDIEDKINMAMNGREIFRFAVNIVPQAVEEVLQLAGKKLEDVKYIIPHQANLRIVEGAAKKLDLPLERFYMNLHKYGNTSAASIPLALDEMNKNGLLQKGDNLVLVGFGGGLTWGSLLIKW
ncbi:3-oxoacyl-[acyl-carrier-protein] synthase 3 [Clostridium polyendosporum]|uniref:Beta-ketoacyl-[acyl-carrier-protein] synthase III n=1 Tax=Clostridium polyendosporum TaxID=69208 RepID=A0A919RXB0_9CLOT|nr:beta-ketoacyl-ACP synthase III [Clostridium polyendosporum]GIM27476.1 3-oxoacyl-[acyl-carrier-protein] synthase 3 [Clostridium polyendosporum]